MLPGYGLKVKKSLFFVGFSIFFHKMFIEPWLNYRLQTAAAPPLGPTATGGGGRTSSTAAPPSAPRQRAAAAGIRFIWIYDHFMKKKSKKQRKMMIFSLLDHIPGAQKRT